MFALFSGPAAQEGAAATRNPGMKALIVTDFITRLSPLARSRATTRARAIHTRHYSGGRATRRPASPQVNLIKQAAQRNYLTSHQVKSLLEVVSYRKGKLEVTRPIEPPRPQQQSRTKRRAATAGGGHAAPTDGRSPPFCQRAPPAL